MKGAAAAYHASMSQHEPGLDRHEWEGVYASLEDDLRDDPRGGLPELADLVERMLEESGFQLDEPVTLEGEERDVVAEYTAAREVSDAVERGDEGVGPGDVASAIDGLRAVYEHLVIERAAP